MQLDSSVQDIAKAASCLPLEKWLRQVFFQIVSDLQIAILKLARTVKELNVLSDWAQCATKLLVINRLAWLCSAKKPTRVGSVFCILYSVVAVVRWLAVMSCELDSHSKVRTL